MELSALNSNHLDAVIRFKKSLAADMESATPTDIILPAERKVNGYGEIYISKMQQKQKRLTEDEIRLLIAGYQAGKSTYTLASEFGCHRQAVSELLRKHGVNVTKCTARKRLNVTDVISMYEAMHTTAEIAKSYGVNPNVILRCLREQGIAIRGRWDYS
ncbi:MAG: helix-turn-helix domain-containing protein [Oscillospiraceae bacterium]|nr:helix-turn-helix domain-containing protein [Oscillospiraceae bacterium]